MHVQDKGVLLPAWGGLGKALDIGIRAGFSLASQVVLVALRFVHKNAKAQQGTLALNQFVPGLQL
jgi:hypothetical protein